VRLQTPFTHGRVEPLHGAPLLLKKLDHTCLAALLARATSFVHGFPLLLLLLLLLFCGPCFFVLPTVASRVLVRQALGEYHGCDRSSACVLEAAGSMRGAGTRIDVANKNIGAYKYSFNPLQVKKNVYYKNPHTKRAVETASPFLFLIH
jgi:hypothetical protein